MFTAVNVLTWYHPSDHDNIYWHLVVVVRDVDVILTSKQDVDLIRSFYR